MSTAKSYRGFTRAEILARIPDDATRVLVRDERGKQRYRQPGDVADTDEIVLGGDGSPVVMTRNPGRVKKALPLRPSNERIAEILQEKERVFEEDLLLATVQNNPEAAAVLDYVLAGLAEEAASLGFERQEAERTGQATSQISMRRINALKAVGDTYLKRREQLRGSGVDMESPAFKRLFAFIMETIQSAHVDTGVRPEVTESVFAKLATTIDDDDWQREANRRMADAK